jgi:Uma2 family endonuclease
MKRSSRASASHGPFRADQLRPGDPYELSQGHPVHCLPTGGRGSKASTVGAGVLASDPAVEDVGFDTGFSPAPDTLRAPDIAVGSIPDEPGWVQGAPALAVEYADRGQDEGELALKIQELLAAGTRYVWVVRLTGPRRVEVHKKDAAMSVAHPGDELQAAGILANPVPVEALYDREAAREIVFRNLLQREGYTSLDAVRAEGEAAGRVEGEAAGRVQGEAEGLRTAIADVLIARGLPVGDDLGAALASANDPAVLRALLRQAATATSPSEVLAALRS